VLTALLTVDVNSLDSCILVMHFSVGTGGKFIFYSYLDAELRAARNRKQLTSVDAVDRVKTSVAFAGVDEEGMVAVGAPGRLTEPYK
jgi:hypothetical protein